MRRLPALCLLLLAACAAPSATEVAQRRILVSQPLPPMKTFHATAPLPPQRSNAEMARDFLELEFRMESGRKLDQLTRFEGPITVTLTGAVPPTAPGDLADVVGRFRREARLDLSVVPQGPASITVEFIPRSRLQSVVPDAACYVVPNVSSFAEYRAARRSSRVDWVGLKQRERVAIFVPSDTSPQEVRDCLHEELAQAMGPLNDLYRLSDSVFNDDNFHTVLTGFDMLMLRVHYAPELANGMTEAQVAARLPGVLARLNPAGQRPGAAPAGETPRAWIEAVETALGPRPGLAERRIAAEKAVTLAHDQGWDDARLAFSYFALGRLSLADDPQVAMAALSQAARIYRTLPDAAIHGAHIDMQIAAWALSTGDAATAILLADRAMPAARRAQNAALLASLMMIKVEALELQGHADQAAALRLDSLGWARYGFGAEAEVRARMSDIAILSPGAERG